MAWRLYGVGSLPDFGRFRRTSSTRNAKKYFLHWVKKRMANGAPAGIEAPIGQGKLA